LKKPPFSSPLNSNVNQPSRRPNHQLEHNNKNAIDKVKVELLIVFEPNKEYVNKVLDEQVNLRPYNMEFIPEDKLPSNWQSFGYQQKVNAGEVPSEIVEERYRER
jgi:hypothetical protein